MSLEKVKVYMEDVVFTAVSMISDIAKAKNITFSQNYEGNFVVNVDIYRLFQ
eukprot:Pgem_evm1s18789